MQSLFYREAIYPIYHHINISQLQDDMLYLSVDLHLYDPSFFSISKWYRLPTTILHSDQVVITWECRVNEMLISLLRTVNRYDLINDPVVYLDKWKFLIKQYGMTLQWKTE